MINRSGSRRRDLVCEGGVWSSKERSSPKRTGLSAKDRLVLRTMGHSREQHHYGPLPIATLGTSPAEVSSRFVNRLLGNLDYALTSLNRSASRQTGRTR